MSVYITSSGHFLPGEPVDNERIEVVLGQVHGKRSRLKRRILQSNGILQRHYAIDAEHNTLYSNSEMAARAGRACLEQGYISPSRLDMLSVATSQGDLVLPGFGSMVQAELGLADIELHSAHGICSSSMMALKAAYTACLVGEHRNALVVASELASRLFKASRYEAAGESVDFNAEFLRWMLSDGAGALLLETRPRDVCFRIDWIRGISHADAYPVCMSVGNPSDPRDNRTWQDFPTYAEAEAAGALLIRQDVRLLDNIVKLGVDGLLRLMDEKRVDVRQIDHVLCHYSSHYFRGRIFDMLTQAGAAIPEEKWYTNLYSRGNTGCASMFIMLDEFRRTRDYQVGDTLLCMVPESGRFNNVYMHLTVVEE
ncbi:beta-ketoacyl-ACP synthase III [Halomonas sp. McH1-25]|uniref:beta-ketoacyl-ACP synthase III n=1 Tax=unclassified Halomonas TaxID=2609666 RepID=UPI001EF5F77A|nr:MULTISPECIES: beta-ketoacyl-ACP synthase III [unclassified Halomonas]MCG7602104.1 beta-ketoacyl-ACP synthase III [Halomonas sp. McH1-25]MCP1343022.1 beta-ketoacyl-ACP synthase III [Halomonas sp. FL8]MCP1362444.1 beta-ketoacyl-ACP synthase III [Halomonas sp. BBD45]MCP1365638.1 beta-ketoacyl-ACP synthase III [Halomonas sp. BBD48]